MRYMSLKFIVYFIIFLKKYIFDINLLTRRSEWLSKKIDYTNGKNAHGITNLFMAITLLTDKTISS